MLAGQQRGAGLEPLEVDGPRPPERALRLERRARDAVEDEVAVRARRGREARVEPVRGVLGREHRDVGRQRRVERLGRLRGGRAARHLDARHLPGRVHARVGAPGDGEPVPAARVDDVERLAERRPRPFAGRAAAPSRGTRRRRTRVSASGSPRPRVLPRAHGARRGLDLEHEPVDRAHDDHGSAGLDRLRGARTPDLARRP